MALICVLITRFVRNGDGLIGIFTRIAKLGLLIVIASVILYISAVHRVVSWYWLMFR